MGSLAFPSAKTPGLLERAHASRPRNEQSRAEASNTALTMTVSTSSESRRPENSLLVLTPSDATRCSFDWLLWGR